MLDGVDEYEGRAECSKGIMRGDEGADEVRDVENRFPKPLGVSFGFSPEDEVGNAVVLCRKSDD